MEQLLTYELSLEHGCEICGVSTRSFCKSCCNAYYCSRKHQKRHWTSHKHECFPIRPLKTAEHGRTLIATRDIKKGEKILEETPIFITPNTRTENGITCLGCCKKLADNDVAPCIRCGWPLCGIQCEMEHHHSNNECRYLEQNRVEPCLGRLTNSYQFLCEIGVLRLLLMKNREPKIWAKILEQDSFQEARQHIEDNMFSLTSVVRFIREEVGINETEDVIDMAFGILRGNAFDTTDYFGFIQCCKNDMRCASLLFPSATIPGVNCVPNAFYSIQGRKTGHFKIACFASMDIPKNDPISMPYQDDMMGTFMRRKVKRTVFFQDCSCKLCADPTEFGTYISAPKCTSCKSGNVISTAPLNSEAEWKCEHCLATFSYLEMLDIVQNGKIQLQSAINSSSVDYSVKGIKEVQTKVLHENHFLVLQTELEVCRRILGIIGFYEIKNITSDVGKILDILVDCTSHLLSIADIIRPGYNRTRGRLLYCLQFGMLVAVLNEQGRQNNQKLQDMMKRRIKKKMATIVKIQEEAEAILSLEKDESSEEFSMLRTLRGELKMAMRTVHF